MYAYKSTNVCMYVRTYVCMCVYMYVCMYVCMYKAVADGPVGPVLAGPTFTQGKNEILFYTRQVINKSARVILALLGLLYCSTANREAI